MKSMLYYLGKYYKKQELYQLVIFVQDTGIVSFLGLIVKLKINRAVFV